MASRQGGVATEQVGLSLTEQPKRAGASKRAKVAATVFILPDDDSVSTQPLPSPKPVKQSTSLALSLVDKLPIPGKAPVKKPTTTALEEGVTEVPPPSPPKTTFFHRHVVQRIAYGTIGLGYVAILIASLVHTSSAGNSKTLRYDADGEIMPLESIIVIPLATGALLTFGSGFLWYKRLDRWLDRSIDPIRSTEALLATPMIVVQTIAVDYVTRPTEILLVSAVTASLIVHSLAHDVYNVPNKDGGWKYPINERITPLTSSAPMAGALIYLWVLYPTNTVVTIIRVIAGLGFLSIGTALITSVVAAPPKYYWIFNIIVTAITFIVRIAICLVVTYSVYPAPP